MKNKRIHTHEGKQGIDQASIHAQRGDSLSLLLFIMTFDVAFEISVNNGFSKEDVTLSRIADAVDLLLPSDGTRILQESLNYLYSAQEIFGLKFVYLVFSIFGILVDRKPRVTITGTELLTINDLVVTNIA